MIRLTPTHDLIAMQINMNFTYEEIFNFLQKQGYFLEPYLWKYEDETFPGGKTHHEKMTFVAIRPWEEPGENHLFLTVFEREVKELLSEI
jgi:predicted metal-dependent hydrolase